MGGSDKIKAALKRIEEGLDAINTNEDWLKYLVFQSRFYQYSLGNTILIYMQNPEATYVMGYKAWNKLGRYVKKGSKGLVILAPCIKKIEVFKEPQDIMEYHDKEGEKEIRKVLSGFRVTYLYDISQTEGSDEFVPVLVKGLTGNTETEKEIYEKLLEAVSKEFVVNEVTGTASKGSYNIETNIISIRSDMGYLQRIKTLLHELAHAYHFVIEPDNDMPRNKRELIAESTAFIVSEWIGLDVSSYSFSYIQSWLKDKKELKQIADTVQKIAHKIINMLAESDDSAFFTESEE